MLVDFNKIEEEKLMEFKGGKKFLAGKFHTDELVKILKGRLEPGATVGKHTHEKDSEIIYVLSGTGKAFYDDGEERLVPGMCHYCPNGHAHGLENDGDEDLIFFAIVPVHKQ